MSIWKLSFFIICIIVSGLSQGKLIKSTVSCTIMQFNIENGGTLVSLPHILAVIHAAHPDVIAIEEAEGNIPLIAEQLGWPYYDTRHHIISRFPIIDPPEGKGIYLFIEISPGKVIAISNVHLPDEPYGPQLIQQGEALNEIYRIEKSVRLSPLKTHLKVLTALAQRSIPTFLAGDFNAPSHLDWIQDAVGKHLHIPRAVNWPVSKAVADAGFRDSYREIHPDPVKEPGFTWWAHRPAVPGWNPEQTDPHDRIDFIYAAGPAKTVASKRIGSCCVAGTEIDLHDWSSDHCAIVSTFKLTPATPPPLISVNKRVITTGEALRITYYSANSAEREGLTITIAPLASAGKNEPITTRSIPHQAHGTVRFATNGWKSQQYEARLVHPSGTIISRIPFHVQAPHEKTQIILNKSIFSYGEPIIAAWKNSPGNRHDWLAIVPRDGNKKLEASMHSFTNAEIAGSCSFHSSTQPSWPLTPGTYAVQFRLDGGDKTVGQEAFTVLPESSSP